MTTNESFDRTLAAWLDTEARGRVADHLTEVLVATRATRQRPGWSSLERWLPVTSVASTRLQLARPILPLLAVLALLAALAVVLVLTIGRPKVILGGGENGRIVFVDGPSLMSVAPDGSGLRRVAETGDSGSGVTISPDGRLVAYLPAAGSLLQIAAITSDGSQPAPVALNIPGFAAPGVPSWGPGSDELVFVASDPTRDHLFIGRADGSSPREIPGDYLAPGQGAWNPAWSPDGQWIAFVRITGPGPGGELVLIHPDGTGERVVQRTVADTSDGATVTWSPDPANPRVMFDRTGAHIVYYDVTTTEVVAVRDGFWASWSPKGDRISYWSDGTRVVPVAALDQLPGQDLRIFPSFGGACGDHPELNLKALCGPVTWSPDGTKVIAEDVSGGALLAFPSDGSGNPLVIDLTSSYSPGSGSLVGWQPIYR